MLTTIKKNKIFQLLFFGNYFYGICATFLLFETSLKQDFKINSIAFYIFFFFSTVFYYSISTIKINSSSLLFNFRNNWYLENKKKLKKSIYFFIIVILISLFFIFQKSTFLIFEFSILKFLILSSIFILSIAYYGFYKNTNLRQIGWLKPFIIGFVWAGWVVIVPTFYYHLKHPFFKINTPTLLALFLDNFIYILILSVLFDIKDIVSDATQKLNTLVLFFGLKKILRIVTVTSCLYSILLIYINYEIYHFSFTKNIVSTLPFFGLIIVIYKLYKPQSLYFFLVIIDGLMLLKASIGIINLLI